MVGYPFDFISPEGKHSKLSYTVGNPMGFYTSWAITTLAHHFVMFIANKNRKTRFKSAKYLLLGDDIVISDKDLANSYSKVISSLGVELSDQKTHISYQYIEFAKRVFTPLGEVSPMSIKGFLEHEKGYSSFFDFLYTNIGRGLTSLKTNLTKCAFKWYNKFRPVRVKFRRVREERIITSLLYYRYSRGYVCDLDLINNDPVTKQLGLSCNQAKVAERLLEQAAVMLYMEDTAKFIGDKQDRFRKAFELATSEPIVLPQGRFRILSPSLEAVQECIYSEILFWFVTIPKISNYIQALRMDTAGET